MKTSSQYGLIIRKILTLPHESFIKLLNLAKLPEDIIRAIEHLTLPWSTVLRLKGEEEISVSDIIHLTKGIF